jgi:uncharacterized protein
VISSDAPPWPSPKLRTRLLCLVAALCVHPACAPLAELPRVPPTPFETATVRIITATDTLSLAVELARTEGQYAVGLMDRDSLAADAGMIFLNPEMRPASTAFHMYRTRIPLDIAFLDERGAILRIQAMEPCPSHDAQDCFAYVAGVEFLAALEVNRGYFSANAVAVGDRVALEDVGVASSR